MGSDFLHVLHSLPPLRIVHKQGFTTTISKKVSMKRLTVRTIGRMLDLNFQGLIPIVCVPLLLSDYGKHTPNNKREKKDYPPRPQKKKSPLLKWRNASIA